MRGIHSVFRPAAGLAMLASLVLGACVAYPTITPQGAVQQAASQLQDAQRHYVADYDPESLKQARTKLTDARKALAANQAQRTLDFAQEAKLSVQLGTIRAALARDTANREKVQRQIDAMKQLAGETQ